MEWNFKLREAICWAQGKSEQAKEAWKESTNPALAKLVFFKYEISKKVCINVLRDGSQELWNKSGGEFAAGLNEALGQVGFSGTIFGAGGIIKDSIADGAVAAHHVPEKRRWNQYGHPGYGAGHPDDGPEHV